MIHNRLWDPALSRCYDGVHRLVLDEGLQSIACRWLLFWDGIYVPECMAAEREPGI